MSLLFLSQCVFGLLFFFDRFSYERLKILLCAGNLVLLDLKDGCKFLLSLQTLVYFHFELGLTFRELPKLILASENFPVTVVKFLCKKDDF